MGARSPDPLRSIPLASLAPRSERRVGRGISHSFASEVEASGSSSQAASLQEQSCLLRGAKRSHPSLREGSGARDGSGVEIGLLRSGKIQKKGEMAEWSKATDC